MTTTYGPYHPNHKARTCPHCEVQYSTVAGFYFMESGDMACEKCKKIIFPIKLTSELEIEDALKKKKEKEAAASARSNFWQNNYQYNATQHGPHQPHGRTGLPLVEGKHFDDVYV